MTQFADLIDPPWDYFDSLDRRLREVFQFIEPSECNFSTYSNALASLLLDLGSEVDQLLNRLCCAVNLSPLGDKPTMGHYRPILLGRFGHLPSVQLSIPGKVCRIAPFEDWQDDPKASLCWWRGYTDIKHDRIANFQKASLQYVLTAYSALAIIVEIISELRGACTVRRPYIYSLDDRVYADSGSIMCTLGLQSIKVEHEARGAQAIRKVRFLPLGEGDKLQEGLTRQRTETVDYGSFSAAYDFLWGYNDDQSNVASVGCMKP